MRRSPFGQGLSCPKRLRSFGYGHLVNYGRHQYQHGVLYSQAKSYSEGKSFDTEEPFSSDEPQFESGRPPLPLSPIMDPRLKAARQRYRKPKPSPRKTLTPFQIRLRDNPFARALATPVRACTLTNARLPEYFLLNIGIESHPKTGAPWLLPRGVLPPPAYEVKDRLSPSISNSTLESVQNRGSSAAGAPSEGTTTCNNERDIAARTMEKPLDDQRDVSSRPRDLSYVFKLAANLGSYILLSRRLMVTLKSKSGASWLQRILPSKIREMRLFSKRSLVWRDDMESFTVDLMRQRIISELSYLGRRPGTYLVKCTTLDEVSLKKQVAGVLWFRSHPIEASRAREETQNSETERGDQIAARTADAEPPPFATLLLGKEEQFHVLVYNLPHLLGNQHLAELQRRLGIENPETAPFTVIKAKRNTLQAQMWLWKLQMLLDSQ